MTPSRLLTESNITQQCRMALLAVLGELDGDEADRHRSDELSLLLEVVRSYRPVPAAVRRVCEETSCREGVSESEWQNRLATFDSWLASFKLSGSSLAVSEGHSASSGSDGAADEFIAGTLRATAGSGNGTTRRC